MKLSLQEQLLKSGLVSSAQAKSVKSDKHKQNQQQRKNKIEVVDEAKELAQKAQAEKLERDRELNHLRQQQEEQKQLAAQIKQIIELNRLPTAGDGLAYNFTDNNKVKRIYVSAEMRDQIAEGRLAIVKLGQTYEVVSAETARKIQSRDAASVIVFNVDKKNAETTDDAYAQYQIPDDLIW
ncbi:DUF2058 domain-containing protein [Methylicorpusculum sp.]|uniref:DUF2058 domain-containing protein n=1 Tax=Methylicorpusculum sp. TaxID=2713644 RepID=UPI00272F9F24|nr:DUF2058 domain-containing protein [Methylicorpusculum sp.]MDP2177347.1 DUF2058 domain-containing protein [Methylicorpusculum sp.]MDP3531006.1 DUF2058 domain-containing protein [Methylicorpusculum sp.]MDZ4151918.1 DUF2058 domain-containing protein [Methylicorpusculum sp.]